GLSRSEFLEDLDEYLSYAPKHVSAYQLTLTPGHPLYSQLPNSEEMFDWFEAVRSFLERKNLRAYETSNFAHSLEDRSEHNLNYWRNFYFIGLGAGASSF